jgi:glycosyltransferase involved in cell wall biosynthesis
VGYVDPSIKNELDRRHDPFETAYSPYSDHHRVLAQATHAHLLVLILGDAPGARGEYTGKIFEYIRLGIPVLATVPVDGVAARLVSDTGTGIAVPYDDVSGIAATVTRFYREWEEGVLHQRHHESRNEAVVQQYRRDVQARKLSEILEGSDRS